VTLTSSNPLVVVSPPSVTIPRGETGASFALQVGNGTGRTILSTGNGRDMSVPVVLPGQTPKLDVMIGGPSYSESYTYGEDFTIPANVLARSADDLLPTGRMQLLDASDQLLAEMTLGADGKASFPRSGLAPGVYRYQARYLGDPNFNPLTVDYPEFRIDGWSTYTTVVMPRVICGNSIEARVTVVTTSTTLPPTGQVELRVGNFVVLVDLTPTDEPGKSTAAAQLPAPTDTYVYATYVPTGTFDSSSGYAFPPAVGGCNPIGLTATATAVNRVSLSWSPTGAASYEIHRADGATGFSFLGYATTNSYLDTQAQADRVYIYRVRPSGGALSEPDIAMTFFFADDPLVANVTVVKAQHLAQLGTAVNFARATARLAAFTPAVAPAKNGVIRASHIQELRTVIAEARRFLGMLPPSWTDPALTVGTRIKAVHIQELRNALK
jgi:hypothetical protein